ncbi:MAG: 2-oxoacid:ferredoxin oxidoreductase subunit beta, partial [Flavobacteriales bacterium]|nr:2-oxoacid:ferredoxin oxidoreductase subunit beta [Flavobacteriales bacterium]
LSIGGNHIIHLLRRNVDVNVLLFNNEIYGLTKGQYSPTSPEGAVTRSTPMGSTDHPFNPLALVKGADGTFIARSMDRDPKHMREVLARADAHRGTSLVEIYQNCNVFNDGAFETFTEKATKPIHSLFVEHGKPLLFANGTKGICLKDMQPRVVDIGPAFSADDCWVHDERDAFKASLLVRLFDDPRMEGGFPRPFGVFYVNERATHEAKMTAQVKAAKERKGEGDLDALLKGEHTWTIA